MIYIYIYTYVYIILYIYNIIYIYTYVYIIYMYISICIIYLYVLYIYVCIYSRISIHHLNQYIHRPKWLNHQISSSNVIIIIKNNIYIYIYVYVIVETRVACSYNWNKPHQPTKIQGLWSENVGDSSWSFKVHISATIRNLFMTWTIGKACLANHLVVVHR